MNYVDIIIIALVAFMALWGLWKSFTKTLVKIICFAIALVGTYLLSNFIVNWLLGIPFINNLIVGNCSGITEFAGSWSLARVYYDAIGGASLTESSAIGGAFGYFIAPMVERFSAVSATYNLTFGQFVAINLAINTLNVVLCVLLYLILRLVVMIIAWLLKLIFVHGEPNWFSRILGFIGGAVRGVALVMVLLVCSTAILPFSWAKNYSEDLGEKSVIGKFASEYTYQIYDWAIYGGDGNTEKTIELLESAGVPKK